MNKILPSEIIPNLNMSSRKAAAGGSSAFSRLRKQKATPATEDWFSELSKHEIPHIPFEKKTDNAPRLLVQGYQRHKLNRNVNGYYLQKFFKDRVITYLVKSGLDSFMKKYYGVVFERHPDEAYLIEFENGKKVLKILDKRSQNMDEAIDNKLWCGKSLKRDFEIVLEWDNIENFTIEYAFCLNEFLTEKYTSDNPKYLRLNQINVEDDIPVFFGEEQYYFERLDMWLSDTPLEEPDTEKESVEASEEKSEEAESEEEAEDESNEESEEESKDESEKESEEASEEESKEVPEKEE